MSFAGDDPRHPVPRPVEVPSVAGTDAILRSDCRDPGLGEVVVIRLARPGGR
ncbi:MAG TPA: hypothetical protein VKE74_06905 [Gemmataceae bacterium]|nr:hypothetical protein [Gemmataceae bacterium]